jgi:HEAT repeat protein
MKIFLATVLLILSTRAYAEDYGSIAGKYIKEEKNDAIRAYALKYLAGCNEPACRKILLDASHDPSWLIRYRAIESMGPSPNLIVPFIDALNDPNDMVRLAAVNGLIKIGEPALDVLWITALDQNPLVRAGVITALARIGPAQSQVYSHVGEFCHEKRKVHEKSLLILQNALKDDDQNVRRSATESFSCVYAGEEINRLFQNAKDPEPDIRSAALHVLAGESHFWINDIALTALNDSNPKVKDAAAALIRNQSITDRNVLGRLLDNSDEKIRCFTIHRISELLNDNNPDENLINLLRSHPAELAACGVDLSEGDNSILKILLELAEKSNDDKFIEKISYNLRHPFLFDSWKQLYLEALKGSRHTVIRRNVAEALGWGFFNFGEEEDRDILKPFLHDKDPNVRFYAALIGAKTEDATVLPILAQLIKNPDQSFREYIFHALGYLLPKSYDFLSLLLRDPASLTEEDIENISSALLEWVHRSNGKYREQNTPEKEKVIAALAPVIQCNSYRKALTAIYFLFQLSPDIAQRHLKKYITSKDPKVKMYAIYIGSVIPENRKILINIIADESETEEIRKKAIMALKYDGWEYFNELSAILKKESTPNKLKREMIKIISLPWVVNNYPRLKKLLNDPDLCGFTLDSQLIRKEAWQAVILPVLESEQTPRNCRVSIAMNLRKTIDPRDIEKLQGLAADKDPEIRATIATVLSEISSSMTLPALETLLQDPDQNVREKAKAAITTIINHLQ